jgi:alpha-tubulin suppressor-like RCC1 family protein
MTTNAAETRGWGGVRIRACTALGGILTVATSLVAVGAALPTPAVAGSTPVVSAGNDFTCALNSSRVFCWGRNEFGQLGDGSTLPAIVSTPVQVKSLPPVVAVSAGGFHACAIDTAALLWCWGYNKNGELGNGTTTNSAKPLKVAGGHLFTHVSEAGPGNGFTCAINTSGVVYCWGNNVAGQLGNGTTTESHVPVKVSALRVPAMEIAAGSDLNACVRLSDGSAQCWGANQFGQLGDGTTTYRHLPVQVTGLTSGITAITTGTGHTCAIRSGGALICWGNNRWGEIGDGTTTNRLVPTPVSGLVSGVQQVSAGGAHTCALINSTAIVVDCWGDSYFGELGNGDYALGNPYTTPQAVFGLSGSPAGGASPVQVSAGQGHTCAVISTGLVECWGNNMFGDVGDGTVGNRAIPTFVIGLTTGPQGVSEGDLLGCALTQTLSASCWGIRDGNDFNSHTSATAVTALTGGVAQLSAGGADGCALSTTGSLRCWGTNFAGEVGNGNKNPQTTPQNVTGMSSGVQAVSEGNQWDTCAITTAQHLWCWGFNQDGELGDGNNTDSDVPVEVGLLAVQISTGASHSCAVSTNHNAYCWGNNDYGQLGDGSTSDSNVPVQVKGLPGIPVQIAAGGRYDGGTNKLDDFTCAVIVTGSVYCWGYNGLGELGNGTTTNSTTPVKVSLPGPARAVVTGHSHTCALLTAGGVQCWGDNQSGQLGNGSSVSFSSSPVVVTALGFRAISISADASGSTCALLTSPAQVECWGANFNDELGDGISGGFSNTPALVLGL